MKTDRVMTGRQCILRQIQVEDCTQTYVDWLNDTKVNQFLETKWSTQDLKSITEFVKAQIEDPRSILFAIALRSSGKHIGNIKVGPIHNHYKYADVSYFIGDCQQWNKGIATEAINLICEFGFNVLDLHRIEAGTYEDAIGSQRALEKNGFVKEGLFKEQVLFNGRWINTYRYGLLSMDFHPFNRENDL